ncbi:hypothetical protein ACFU3E_09650 [Streptomyces sp. NPDC057424]|uniref:hypothetical protein n=1 Tax=Streptomyces sp. NPDC057424 TaxID=3346127 RepID=UPI0036C9D40D
MTTGPAPLRTPLRLNASVSAVGSCRMAGVPAWSVAGGRSRTALVAWWAMPVAAVLPVQVDEVPMPSP